MRGLFKNIVQQELEDSQKLRRSNRQTKNKKPIVDDFEYPSDIEEELKEDIEHEQQNILARTRAQKPLQKQKQKQKQQKQTKKKTKKAKDDDDDDYQISQSEEQQSSSQSDQDEYNDQDSFKQKKVSDEIMGIFDENSNKQSDNENSTSSSQKNNFYKQCYYLRNADQYTREQARFKEQKEKQRKALNSVQVEVEEQKNHKNNGNKKRSRQQFEEEIKNINMFYMPPLQKDKWPKYVGSIQIKAKVQFEIHNYIKKVEFIRMSKWATNQASNIQRGQQLQVDFRYIEENRDTNLTLGLKSSKMHTNISINKATFGIFAHNYCEIWNLLAYKNYIQMEAFCVNPYDSENYLDESKAFDILLDIYIKEDFVKNPIIIEEIAENEDEEQEKEDSEKKSKESDEKKKQKQPKKSKFQMTAQQIQQSWDRSYVKYMKEAIPLFIKTMELNITKPALIQQKSKSQFQLMKQLALKRKNPTLPPVIVIKSEEMRDYYLRGGNQATLQKSIPLYIYKDIEQLDKLEFEYGQINMNTREDLGLEEKEEKIKDEELNQLNEQLVNANQSKYYVLTGSGPNFLAPLFDYQKQGLSWLLYREGKISKKELYAIHMEQYEEDRELNPFFEEIELPDGYKFYHNVFSGYISDKFVKAKHTYGGILADQMGLGKTIMSLALIHWDLENQKNYQKSNQSAGTLIVMPLPMLQQWEKEIERNSATGSLTVLNLHSFKNEKKNKKDDEYEKAIKQADIVLCPYNLLGSESQQNSIIFQFSWHRIILDEAQKIKNRKAVISRAAFSLKGTNRWCLTGTPIENRLDDLFSLLHFLKMETFGEWFWWNSYINQNTQDQFDILRQILKPILLRRTKISTDKHGNDILELPNKNIFLQKVKLNKNEKRLYDFLHFKSKALFEQLNQQKQEKDAQNNYIHIFQVICKLRQFCVHPSLVFKDVDLQKLTNFESVKQQINSFFDKYKEKIEKDLELQKKLNFLVSENQFNKNNVISDIYRKELIEQINKGNFKNCLICYEEITIHSLSVCGHILCQSCFEQSIRIKKSCPICRHNLQKNDIENIMVVETNVQNEKIDDESLCNYDFNNPQNIQGSKVKKILEIIEKIHKKNEKVVVFTQWLGMIDILDHQLYIRKIPYERLDGTKKTHEKEKITRKFESCENNNDNTTVLIASIKTASLGLNLVAANNVILCDPWWNPAVEDQAIERVHRIGQKKEVFVWRVICEDTIEEKVIQLHDKKREMIKKALSCNEFQRKNNAIQDLEFLLK